MIVVFIVHGLDAKKITRDLLKAPLGEEAQGEGAGLCHNVRFNVVPTVLVVGSDGFQYTHPAPLRACR